MASKKINLAVLISGSGSNLQALIDACARDDFPARIAVVLSNKGDAFGLTRAQKAGIPTEVISHKDHDGREPFEAAIIKALTPYAPDLICLAGFMRILTPHFINHWGAQRMINIHPSLLPDYKGLNTHQRAIDDDKDTAGCTVHFVAPEVDSGEIITQKQVPIHPDDTAETLAKRVLVQEHIAYPEAVERVAKTLLPQ
ncbi:MAG: phosphoribosylglycinamide formyltransferase [Alphaproteobacteria bacterium]|nr:phosphoribosylglycinamide formyltransferase [Alphaproteobacteria bacterium]|tara:strand:+ start:15422 stop:16015 length:594 start_codon:yes stop_codon:yes gene_type:complete